MRFLKSTLSVALYATTALCFSVPVTAEENVIIPGKFAWADLYAVNPEKTAEFYTALFGWTVETTDFGYDVFLNDGIRVGGLVQREHSQPMSGKGGSTARWVPYIASENLHEVVARAVAAGGESIRPVTPLADRGELALLRDSQGAFFGGARPALGSKPDKLASPGDWIYKRLFAKDTSAAADFYSKTFGYQAVLDTSTLIEEDYVLISQGFNRAAIMPLPADSDKPSLWVGFVRVEDLELSIQKVTDLGGSVIIAPQTDLIGGTIAIVADPEGAPIGLFDFSGNSN